MLRPEKMHLKEMIKTQWRTLHKNNMPKFKMCTAMGYNSRLKKVKKIKGSFTSQICDD